MVRTKYRTIKKKKKPKALSKANKAQSKVGYKQQTPIYPRTLSEQESFAQKNCSIFELHESEKSI